MKFEEIFKEKGLYVADSFAKGFAFEISENSVTHDLELNGVNYEDKNDISPIKHPIVVYAGLFKKDYKKVFTRQSLFV